MDVNKELKFCENSKIHSGGGGGGWGRVWRGGGGQGGCERRIEVLVKIKKTNRGEGGWVGVVGLGVG